MARVDLSPIQMAYAAEGLERIADDLSLEADIELLLSLSLARLELLHAAKHELELDQRARLQERQL